MKHIVLDVIFALRGFETFFKADIDSTMIDIGIIKIYWRFRSD